MTSRTVARSGPGVEYNVCAPADFGRRLLLMLDLDYPLYIRAPGRWIHEYSTVDPVGILKISS